MTVEVRVYHDADWPAVWAIVREVVRAGDTFPYDPRLTGEQARALWIESAPGLSVVAVDGGRVVGTAKMGPNRAGPGAHVSTASFMVPAAERRRGVGRALLLHALGWAPAAGYDAMVFNAVVETNRSAVDLYRRHGFEIVGTVPRAFEHPVLGRVGLHVMHREFP